MSTIPPHIRNKIAELGRLSGPLDDSRARQLGSALAETVAKQLNGLRDPTPAISLFEARIATEVSQTKQRKSAAAEPSFRPALKDSLQTFAVDDHYKYKQACRV